MTNPVQLWTQEQVDKLNAHQADRRYHPYTCPGDLPDCEKHRELVATVHGWVCACGEYKQNWAHGITQ